MHNWLKRNTLNVTEEVRVASKVYPFTLDLANSLPLSLRLCSYCHDGYNSFLKFFALFAVVAKSLTVVVQRFSLCYE